MDHRRDLNVRIITKTSASIGGNWLPIGLVAKKDQNLYALQKFEFTQSRIFSKALVSFQAVRIFVKPFYFIFLSVAA